ncbi:unnamed protein product [Coffea canephora]|uniref:R13L1/DRL21-like LRR repeat region domain-containing protein n=1 Tax=Coffea canephora TaxID=49390 RepID=A0A068V9D4_COFCA|nr:unnamed protein product [Coffea canephora]
MNLKELVITNYSGNKFPGWLSLLQLKLTNIQLQGCSSCSILPALGQLPLLKTLYIEECPELTELPPSLDNHDSLQLTTTRCPGLQGWEDKLTNAFRSRTVFS